jgi:pyruvate,water dikinase
VVDHHRALPRAVSRLFTCLFPSVTAGWETASARYGLPIGPSRWAAVRSWYYFSPGRPDPATFAALEEAAAETLRIRRWRAEVERWLTEERPAAVAANLDLQAVDLPTLDDRALAHHVDDVVDHFLRTAPTHFDHMAFDVSFSLLLELTARCGIDDSETVALLAGASPATVDTAERIGRIAAALRDAGVHEVDTLDDVAATSPEARTALDDYLLHYGWRSLGGHEVLETTLGERPELVVATIRHALGHPPRPPVTPDPSPVRERLPDGERAAFDELLADARHAYQLRDDDVGLTYVWPMGLLRRAVLEAGRRLTARGVLRDVEDLFEADPEEIVGLLRGDRTPGPDELAERTDRRVAAGAERPPFQLGEPAEGHGSDPLPPTVARLAAARDRYWGAGGQPQPGRLQGIGIGTEPARGRVCVVSTPGDLDHLEPGDVLVAIATTTSLNAAFPLVAGVATAEGGAFSHAAILSREYGVPAVVGVGGLLDDVHEGDLVEVDPLAGAVRILVPAPEPSAG